MSESPKYRVIKAMPGLAVGDVIERKNSDHLWTQSEPPESRIYLTKKTIELNPDYFQLIEEARWTDSDMKDYSWWVYERLSANPSMTTGFLEWTADRLKTNQPEHKKPWSAADDWERPASLSAAKDRPATLCPKFPLH